MKISLVPSRGLDGEEPRSLQLEIPSKMRATLLVVSARTGGMISRNVVRMMFPQLLAKTSAGIVHDW